MRRCMTNEIMTLALDEVVPDPEQPRQYFDREAMERLRAGILSVGQLQPIRVRRADDGWMIVDGQRRWLSLCSLNKQFPDDERFQTIHAFDGGDLDVARPSRLAVQVLSNCGEDLTPIEKAEALEEIRRAEPELSVDELAGRLGVPQGQIQFLKQLGSAPDFIKAMGAGTPESPAQPLWNLVTLIRLHSRLRKWDNEQFRESAGAHQRIADTEVRRLGVRAQNEGWGKRKLQAEADRVVRRIQGEDEREGSERDRLAAVRRFLARLNTLGPDERGELISLLRSHLPELGAPLPQTARSPRTSQSNGSRRAR
jgi:ParB/RepB/Spo0J family partition protein